MSPLRINLRICRHCPDCEARPENGGCSGPCKCLINGEDIHKLAAENDCPAGKFPGLIRRIVNRLFDSDPAPPKRQPLRIQTTGPALWADLHQWALFGDIDRPILWLGKFTDRLGALGCNCANDWKAWMLANPPNVASRDNLFVWTVEAHNGVNARLNKPQMSVDDARKRWS